MSIACAAVVACVSSGAFAAEHAVFLNAPAVAASPVPKLAVQFGLKLHLPEGKGLARLLIDAGVNQEDAAEAAKLAAGHLGAGLGGCEATVSIERSAGGGFSLVRVQLSTDARQAVIERRGNEFTLASDTPTSHSLRLV
ncbi:MAG: hypothetical protein ACJ8FT_11500 [Sphingomonas sp.]